MSGERRLSAHDGGTSTSKEQRHTLLGIADIHQARKINLTFMMLGLVLLLTVTLFTFLFAKDLGDTMTRNTIRLSLAWYSAAILLMLNQRTRDWAATTPLGFASHWCWTWAMLIYLVHVAMAFHFFHHWSHADAFERTRQISGTGEGIFVSYFFTLIWATDVAWWWIGPKSYADRPAFLGRCLHGFMLFIIFNATVIYEDGPIRWVGLLIFATFSVMWIETWRRLKANR